MWEDAEEDKMMQITQSFFQSAWSTCNDTREALSDWPCALFCVGFEHNAAYNVISVRDIGSIAGLYEYYDLLTYNYVYN